MSAEVTTSSLEAWRSYSAAMKSTCKGDRSGNPLAPEAGHRDRPQVCDRLCLLGRL